MLATLRKQSKSVIIYVLFGIIIIVFVFTFNVASPDAGCASFGSSAGGASVLAKVGDAKIDINALYMGMALTVDPPAAGKPRGSHTLQQEFLYRATRFPRLGGDPKYARYGQNPAEVSLLKPQKVMEDLVETYLVSEEARKLGLRASDAEVASLIVPSFKDQNGRFRKRQYENWVRYGLHTSLGAFENFVRREILRQKMIDLLATSVTVPKSELDLAVQLSSRSRKYEFLEFREDELAEAMPAEPDKVEEFAAKHADRIQDYYEKRKAEFRVEPSYDLSLIKIQAASRSIMALIDDPEQLKPLRESWQKAKEKADQVEKMLEGKSGEGLKRAFAEAATRYSDFSATRESGGRFPERVTESRLRAIDGALVEVATKTEPGQAAGPIKGDDGYYFLLLYGRVEGRERPLEEVRTEIAKRLSQLDKAKKVMPALVQEALEKAKQRPERGLDELAKELNARYVPAIAIDQLAVGDKDQKSPQTSHSPVVPIKYGDTGKMSLLPKPGPTELPEDPEVVPSIGKFPELAKKLLRLTPKHPVLSEVFKIPDGTSYVIRLAEVKTSEPSKEDVQDLQEKILEQRRVAWYREWYGTLKKRAQEDGRLVLTKAFANLLRDEAEAAERAAKEAATAGHTGGRKQ